VCAQRLTSRTDPAIIGADSRWYAFATRNIGGDVHIQVAESADFNTWSLVKNADGSQKDALPNLPSWVDGGNSNTVSIRLDCDGRPRSWSAILLTCG